MAELPSPAPDPDKMKATSEALEEMKKTLKGMEEIKLTSIFKAKAAVKSFSKAISSDLASKDFSGLQPVTDLTNSFVELAKSGGGAIRTLKALTKSYDKIMGMRMKMSATGGIGAEEAARERERTEEARHNELIEVLKKMTGAKLAPGDRKGGFLSGLLGGAGSIISGLARGIVSLVNGVIETISKIFESLLNLLTKFVRLIGNAIKTIGTAVGKAIEGILTGVGRGLAVMGNPQALLGAAVLAVVAGGIFILAKAFQEFTKVNFSDLLVGIAAIGVLTATLVGLGALMLSGIGAAALLAGAAAFGIMALAAMGLGKAFIYLGEGLEVIMPSLNMLSNTVISGFMQLSASGVGTGLIAAAAGITAVGVALASFMALSAVGGVAAGIGSLFGGPGPFQMLDKFIAFASAAPLIREGADAINHLAAALKAFSETSLGTGDQLDKVAMVIAAVGASSRGDELNMLQSMRARVTQRGPRSSRRGSIDAYHHKLDLLDEKINKLRVSISSGGYAAGVAMDSSSRRLQDARASQQAQLTTPRYQEINTMQMNQTQQYLGGTTARSPSMDDDDI